MNNLVDGFWKTGFWSSDFWADGFWQEERHVGGWGGIKEHRRTRKDIEEARKKFGLVFEVIEEVAQRQSKDLHLDEQQRFEELHRELKLRNLEFEKDYLIALNDRREHLINVGIGILIRKRILEEEEAIFMLLVMSLQ